MLARQRQDLILEEVRTRGAVKVSELVELLDVSDMTVRRDLDVLSDKGLLDKVHGGAAARQDRSVDEPGFEVKSMRALSEKESIARSAVTLVHPGMAVGVSAGTTTWTLAHLLRDVPALTIVTNSMRIADVFLGWQSQGQAPGRAPGQTVVLTGGIRTPSDALVGPVAVHALRSLHLDAVFLGVHGMDEAGGFTTPNLMESETNRALVDAARQLIVVADHTKWGVVGLSTIVGLEAAQVLVSDSGLPQAARDVLSSRVGRLILAENAA